MGSADSVPTVLPGVSPPVSLVEGGRGVGALRVPFTGTDPPAAPQSRAVATRRHRRRRPPTEPGACGGGAPVITIVALFGVVVFHVLLNQGQMQLDRLQTRAGQEHARTERLKLDLAELQSPAPRRRGRRDRLGMVPPAGVAYLVPGSTARSGAARGRAPGRPAAARARRGPRPAAGSGAA